MQEKHGNLTTLVRDDTRFCADPVTDFGQKDGSTFEPNKYFARLLKEKSLNGLMAKDNELVAGKWTIFSCICRRGRMITDTCPRRNKRNWWWYEDIGIRELQQVYQCYRHDTQGLNIAVPLKKKPPDWYPTNRWNQMWKTWNLKWSILTKMWAVFRNSAQKYHKLWAPTARKSKDWQRLTTCWNDCSLYSTCRIDSIIASLIVSMCKLSNITYVPRDC